MVVIYRPLNLVHGSEISTQVFINFFPVNFGYHIIPPRIDHSILLSRLARGFFRALILGSMENHRVHSQARVSGSFGEYSIRSRMSPTPYPTVTSMI